jgi:hypothetical protein
MERMGSRAVIERAAKAIIIDAKRKKRDYMGHLNSPESGATK